MRRRLAPLLLVCLAVGWPAVAAAGPARQERRARSPVKAGARRQAMRRPAPRPKRKAATTPERRLREELEAIWAGRTLRRGTTAVYVVDARTGKDIYAVHPDDKLNPASNVKLLSTATVLDLVGPRWRYLTRFYGPAPDAAGVARGDVYLRGNADPTLTRAALEELARTVARAGVKKIEGSVLLSDDALREKVAPPRIGVKVRAAARTGAAPTVTIEPPGSFVKLDVTAKTTASRRARLVITAEALPVPVPAPGQGLPAGVWDGPRVLVRVGGTIRKGRSGSYVRRPRMQSTFAGYALRQYLRAAGVEVTGGVRLADFDGYTREALAAGYLPIELARHRSQSMKELVARVNKRSLNALADRLLMTAGSERTGGGPPSMESGLEAMYGWLERTGLDRRQIVLDTGSGLSHKTELTARNLVRVLRTSAGYTGELTQGLLDPATFLASLAVGGVDGTLRGRFRSDALRGRVVGKTGTLSDSVALSGFLSDDSGPALCFSIVTNGNRWGARYRIRREHELMVAAMKRYLDARGPAAGPTRVVVDPETPRPAAVERAASAPADGPDDEEGGGDATADDEPGDAARTPGGAPTQAAAPAAVARPEREPRRPDAVAPQP